MHDSARERLWSNTLGFLERSEEALARFGVALKRGVLLTGRPGNGKTMAARWLAGQAARRRLDWRTVSAEQYEMARSGGHAADLFRLERPGIIFFDDLDSGLRDRAETMDSRDQSTFLSELDGITPKSGVVYLFTSNAGLDELDPAFRRPGRIDLAIDFPHPDSELRRRLIVETWSEEIVEAIPVDEVVERTGGLCFAEVDELKKLLVIDYLDSGCWNWPRAWSEFRERASTNETRPMIGFAANGASRCPERTSRELPSGIV